MKICVGGRKRVSPVVAGARIYFLLHIPFMVINIQNFFLRRAAPAPEFKALRPTAPEWPGRGRK